MDDYATLTWTGYDHSISGKKQGSYIFSVTLTPKTGTALTIPVEKDGVTTNETTELAVSGKKTSQDSGTVHILTPVIRFQDSTIHKGFHPNADHFNKNDFVSVVKWVAEDGKTHTDNIVGTEPTLTYTYDPYGDFAQDTPVDVTVTSSNGNEDITSVVTFQWITCKEHNSLPTISEHKGTADLYEFYVHVSGTKAMDDTIVIDFGLPVQIDVIANDVQPPEANYALLGISKENTPGSFSTAAVSGRFGTLTMADGKVVYTPSSMSMNAPEIFYYVAQCEYGLFYGTITVIPATTIYYEDDLPGGIKYQVFDQVGTQWKESTTNTWQMAGSASSGIQNDDRPGTGNDHGYDSAYDTSATYSMGTAHYVVVNDTVYATATFRFCGTGLDIISKTDDQTGFIIVDVYSSADPVDPIRSYAVDTYYSAENGLYQVPVMNITGLDYGDYTVVITVAYSVWLDPNQADPGYRIYLHGIRIYDPTGVASGATANDTVRDAYDADGEHHPVYEEVRDIIIDAGSFGSLTVQSNGSTIQQSGAVFIDGMGDTPATIEDYTNMGPNNEVYLAPGQSVAFGLSNEILAKDPVDVQIGLKSVGGTVSLEMFNPGTGVSTVETDTAITAITAATKSNSIVKTLHTATDMYYGISQLKNGTIVITNTGESGILSITDLKFTFADSVEPQVMNIAAISQEDAVSVLRSLNAYSVSLTVQKDVDETPGAGEDEQIPTDPDEDPKTGDLAMSSLIWVAMAAAILLAVIVLETEKRKRGEE